MMISDSEYNRAIEAPEPAIYSGALYGFRTLFYNIRVNGVFVARICVDEVVTPFTSRDFALIKILGQYLARHSRENIYYFNRPRIWMPFCTACFPIDCSLRRKFTRF